MRKKLIWLLVLSALLTLGTACGAGDDVSSASPSPSSAPSSTPSAVEDPAITTIKERFSDLADSDHVNVSAALGMTTVDVFDPDWAATIAAAKGTGAAPADWESQKAALTELTTDLPLLSDTSNAVVYVRASADGEIYLTAANGSILFDVFAEAATYNDETISLDEFNQITTGMSYDEVVAIIGSQGELLSESDLGLGPEYATSMWMWEGEGSIGANANVTFQGGSVIGKAQFGLE